MPAPPSTPSPILPAQHTTSYHHQKMARQRKTKEPSHEDIKLRQPDRSGPTEQTLLGLAQERNLFDEADERMRKIRAKAAGGAVADEDVLSPGAERVFESCLWTASLAMLHFTFDILVHRQYGEQIEWPIIIKRAGMSFIAILALFYPLHPHDANPTLVPRVPAKYQHPIRQAIFFAMSVAAGCSLIYVTNYKGYIANMKRAPPLACIWLWAVIELDLPWAALSLLCAVGYLFYGGYSIF
ncbi:hypothetical protein HJFPF1_06975 [Paramyrothecium foliicola]|nr:hypothetical protein HJFPF1_06975 [Paramyrothecium foliicola]